VGVISPGVADTVQLLYGKRIETRIDRSNGCYTISSNKPILFDGLFVIFFDAFGNGRCTGLFAG
jgi:hypothetical protein